MSLLLVVLPILAGLLLYALPANDRFVSKTAGCVVAAGTFVLAVMARGGGEFTHRWLSRPFAANFHFALGGISLWIVLLLAVCTFCAILAADVPRLRNFVALLLWLEGTMIGVFTARDLLAFALFWDLMLIPVFFCLTGWGRHRDTAWRYIIYNFSGGLALLLATAGFGVLYGTTDVIGGPVHALVGGWAPWIFAGFALAFLVKTPVWPFHTWMPPAYADTPSPMVAVVSAVQSKAGLYGFIVIGLPFLRDAMRSSAWLFIALGLISLLYGAFVALTQSDAKRVVAYSSLSHLGLILLAVFSFNAVALQGALIYIVAHGLFSAALFLVIGFVEGREGTRSLAHLGGLGRAHPKLAGAFTIAALAALGLPGLAGFSGEIIILTGVYRSGAVWPALIALIPIVLAAGYMLRLLQGFMNGPSLPEHPARRDLTFVEALAVAPLFAALVYLGTNPHVLAGTIALVTQ